MANYTYATTKEFPVDWIPKIHLLTTHISRKMYVTSTNANNMAISLAVSIYSTLIKITKLYVQVFKIRRVNKLKLEA
jgi:hypothetical protein